jgi:hypothetical protein
MPKLANAVHAQTALISESLADRSFITDAVALFMKEVSRRDGLYSVNWLFAGLPASRPLLFPEKLQERQSDCQGDRADEYSQSTERLQSSEQRKEDK